MGAWTVGRLDGWTDHLVNGWMDSVEIKASLCLSENLSSKCVMRTCLGNLQQFGSWDRRVEVELKVLSTDAGHLGVEVMEEGVQDGLGV